MKRLMVLLAMMAAITMFSGCATNQPTAKMDSDDMQMVAKGPFTLDKKGKLDLSGSGFPPHSNVVLIFNSNDGIKSDLSDALKPLPKANANGDWSTSWSYGRMVSKKIIKAGAYTIDIVDEDYNKISSVIVTFAQ